MMRKIKNILTQNNLFGELLSTIILISLVLSSLGPGQTWSAQAQKSASDSTIKPLSPMINTPETSTAIDSQEIIYDIRTPFDWYVPQGYLADPRSDYSQSYSADCGPATVAMAIRYLSEQTITPTPYGARLRYNGEDCTGGKNTNVHQQGFTWPCHLEKMLFAYGIDDLIELSYENHEDTKLHIESVIRSNHLVLLPVMMGDISRGPILQRVDFDSQTPPVCPSQNEKDCVQIDGILYHYSRSQSQTNYNVGRYSGYTGGHWIILKGFGEIDGESYFIVYDPAVFLKKSSSFYSGDWFDTPSLAKGWDRWYKASEVLTGFNNNGSNGIIIPHEPGYLTGTRLSSTHSLRQTTTQQPFIELQQLSHVTIPPGTDLAPNQVAVKTWNVLNNGNIWLMRDYSIKQISGYPLRVFGDNELSEIRNGEPRDVSLIFETPSNPGTYESTWQVVDGNGTPTPGVLNLSFDIVGSGERPVDLATFVSDVTLPDHTAVTPGEPLTKIWRVRNSGTSIWDGYKLIFVSGDQMSAPSPVDIQRTLPGDEVEISVPIIAPQTSSRGDWQIVNPDGTWVRYGQLWVILDVPGTDPINTTAIDLECLNDTCPAVVAPGQTFRPTIRAKVNNGQILASRNDMLRNTDGNLFGAWPHIAVEGTVNEGQNYDFTFYENDPLRAPDQEGTYETKWRVWRNGNWAGEEITIRFEVRQGAGVNHPPDRPTLTGPGDWAVYYGNTGITLQAQHNGDPDDGDSVNEYYFDIFESAQTANSGWITSNSWSPQGLGFNGYQWRVQVRDNHGNESDWSDQVWHFNILNNDPEIYDFHSETCWDEWGGSEKLCFCAQTNAGTLKVQINTANDGSTSGEWHVINELGVPNYECDSTDDRPPNLDPLPYEDGRHVVRLYARREGGWENAAHQDITVDLPSGREPNAPPLRLPLDHSYVNDLTVRFDWEETLRTNEYRLEISTVPDFSTLLVDTNVPTGTTEYTHTFSTDYETIYWRVTATGPGGTNQSGWRFHIDLDAPSSSVTTLPPVTPETKFTVNWGGSDARSGLRWYHVQVRDASRPDSQWEDWLVNTTKTTEMFQAQPGHTYAFRVRAMDNVGHWEDWPTDDHGDTYTLVDPSAAPPTAWWDASYAWKHNLIILNNDSDTMPTHFPVHLHFDDTTTPTAAEIYNASLAATKGDDVRVVYDNQTELDRFVQRFTSSQIDLWFPLQGGIGGGATNNGSYQIYYGNAGASNPPADVNDVFLPTADSNTMGLWHFQEGNGSTVGDTSGRNHHGTFNNAGWADGHLGYTGSFNGSNAYVEIGHSDDFKPGAITLEAWIYLSASPGNYPMIFNKDRYWFRVRTDGEIQFMIKADGGDRYVTSQTKLSLNQWYHVAATYDGGQRMRVYINGNQDKEENNGAPPVLWNDHPLRIGRSDYDGGSYFPGYIQHARVSNVERTDFSYGRINVAPSVEAGTPVAPPAGGSADLAVQSLTTYPNPGGGLLVQAVVQNQGTRDTQDNFFTDLYVNHLPTGEGDYSGSVRFWINSPIEAGVTVTLTTVVTELAGLGGYAAQNLASLAPGSEITGTLYAQVDSVGVISETDNVNNIYGSGVAVCLASPDAYDAAGDDAYEIAPLIALGETQNHNVDGPADRDWVKFQAQGGVTYTLSTSDLDSGADTYLYLYDTDGATLLAANDDYGGSPASHIDWAAPVTGTYYLLVQHWNPNVGGCGTSYALSFSETEKEHTIYLPLVTRNYSAPVSTQTLTAYSQTGDGEVGRIQCATWAECRGATLGSLAFATYENATVGGSLEADGYVVKRVFFYFDTSSLPANAVIQSATLHFYAGTYQYGSDRRVHVVRSTQASPLSHSDFAQVGFASGGFVDLTPNAWFQISLNTTGQAWIVKEGITRLALMHNVDIENSVPGERNDAIISMAEDSAHQSYLTVKYIVP
jgi:hypothetical protein